MLFYLYTKTKCVISHTSLCLCPPSHNTFSCVVCEWGSWKCKAIINPASVPLFIRQFILLRPLFLLSQILVVFRWTFHSAQCHFENMSLFVAFYGYGGQRWPLTWTYMEAQLAWKQRPGHTHTGCVIPCYRWNYTIDLSLNSKSSLFRAQNLKHPLPQRALQAVELGHPLDPPNRSGKT